jgi:hypothetical protein
MSIMRILAPTYVSQIIVSNRASKTFSNNDILTIVHIREI